MKLKDNSHEGMTYSTSPSSMAWINPVSAIDYSKIELEDYPTEDPILEKLEAIKNDIANFLIDGYVKLSGETVTTNEEKLNILSNSLHTMKLIDLNMIDEMVNAGEFEKAIVKVEND